MTAAALAERPAAPDVAPRPSRRASTALAATIGAALVVRLVVLFGQYHTFVDDTYIFLRYAANAASGKGLVYNPGENVQGFTSPLYTLLLTGIAKVSGVGRLVGSTQVLAAVLFVAASAVIARLALRHHRGAWIFIVGWCFWFPFIDASVNGMETLLFLFLSYAAVGLALDRRHDAALVVLALVVLTRPEGALFALALVAAAWWSGERRLPWRGATASAAMVAAWVAFALARYGSIIPQSIRAKAAVPSNSGTVFEKVVSLTAGLSSSEVQAASGWQRALLVLLAIVLAAGTVAGLVRYVRARSPLAAVAAFPVLTWALYVVGDPVRIWSWYAVPTAVAVWWTVSDLVAAAAVERTARERRPRVLAVAAGVAVVLAATTIVPGLHHREQSFEASTTALRRVAAIIHADAPDARVIAVGDIGVIGWQDDGRIVDLNGLVTPAAVARVGDRQITVQDLVASTRPDVVVLLADRKYFDVLRFLVVPPPGNAPDGRPFDRYAAEAPAGTDRVVFIRCGLTGSTPCPSP